MEKETIEHKEKTILLISISQRIRPAIRGLMIGMTAHVASGENAPGALAIAGVLSTKSILTEFAKTNDKAFWANFFINTGIATLLITKFQYVLVDVGLIVSQLITEMSKVIGGNQLLSELSKLFGEYPLETYSLLIFMLLALQLTSKVKATRVSSKNYTVD